MADKNMEAQISVEFEEATSRQSLNSGETINTLWSKVKRWLSDLKAVAFSGSYNDLSDKPKIPNVDSELSETSENPVQNKIITSALNNKAESNHVHSYAGSSSEGGSATSAVKLDSSAGSTVNPVYFSEGKPIACTYTLGKSVPSNAVFTDTVYTLPKATTSALGGVIPDGTSITVDENGVISGSSGGSTGGMKLIGSYAVTYSGTATSGNDWSDRIELPIDLYENNRTLLIRTKVDHVTPANHRLFQNYSMIKIEIPYDIYDTGKYQIIYSPYYQIVNTSDKTAFQLYYYPETNKLSIALCFYVSYLGSTFLDVYDMGVIE